MKLSLRQQLTQFSYLLQSSLFPVLEESLGEIGPTGTPSGGDPGDDPAGPLRAGFERLDGPAAEEPVRVGLCLRGEVRLRDQHDAGSDRSSAQ